MTQTCLIVATRQNRRFSHVFKYARFGRLCAGLLALASVLVMHRDAARADNWAHWRGPTGNGVAPNATPPLTWSRTENVKWKTVIPGRGSGSPVIWEDRVFVATAVPTDDDTGPGTVAVDTKPSRPPRGGGSRGRGAGQRRGGGSGANELPKLAFMLFCIDRETGAVLWRQVATVATPHQGTHPTHGFASASPCTDGNHVYAHFGSRGLYCFTMDGKLAWKRYFGKMDTRNSFGEGSSPTLEGDKILVPWDHEGPSSLYALDKESGEVIWRAPRDEPTCWATPLVVEHEGAKQVIMNGQTCARAYSLETGEELWRCAGQTERPVASPVVADGLVIIGSGFRGWFLGAFHLDGRGDLENTKHVAWTLDRNTPDIASPLLSDGRVYFHRGKTGLLSCVDAATGAPYYFGTRLPGLARTYASPIAAGGHVYLTGRSGTTVVIKDDERLEVVATNEMGETIDATPAPVDNELFIRGENHLYCVAE